MAGPLIETRDLSRTFRLGRGQQLRAVSGVNLTLQAGETLAVAGESGCGRSTLARLLEPTGGAIRFDGTDVAGLSGRAEKAWRRGVQMVFQDPNASLNPRMTAHGAIREPLDNVRDGPARERDRRVHDLLLRLGLNAPHGRRYPHELAGG